MTLNEARMKRESSFKRVKPSVFSVAAISPRKLPAVATTTANKAMRGSNGQNAALALDKVCKSIIIRCLLSSLALGSDCRVQVCI